jgi:hypothetical protein
LVPSTRRGLGASPLPTPAGFTYLGELFHDLTVAPGEFKDLGDIKTVPPKLGK